MTTVFPSLLLGSPDGPKQVVACARSHAGSSQLLQPVQKTAQTAAAHGPFLGDTIPAPSQDVGLMLLGQQLHLHAFPSLLPGAIGQISLQFVQSTLRRAHQIGRRWIAALHLLEHLFGRNATVHEPEAAGLAVLAFDAAEEVSQGLVVGGVTRQHLVGQRETFWGDDQGDDNLNAIASVVAGVPMPAFVTLRERRIALEVGAGQVVEQHLVGGVEKIAPSIVQVRKQCLLVIEQAVMAAVESILGGQGEITTQEIGQRRVVEPMAMETQFAARVDEPVGDQDVEDSLPVGALAG